MASFGLWQGWPSIEWGLLWRHWVLAGMAKYGVGPLMASLGSGRDGLVWRGPIMASLHDFWQGWPCCMYCVGPLIASLDSDRDCLNCCVYVTGMANLVGSLGSDRN